MILIHFQMISSDEELDLSSEEEYILNSEDESEDEKLVLRSPTKNKQTVIIHDHLKKTNKSISPSQSLTSTSTNSLNCGSIEVSFVDRTTGKKGRLFDRRQACKYCSKLHSNISQHLKACHSNESDVTEVLKYPPGFSRNILLDKIRHEGNFNHNINVLQKGSDNLIVVKRSNYKITYKQYLPCIHCLGFYKADELYKHTPHCKHLIGNDTSTKTLESKLLLATHLSSGNMPKLMAKRGRMDEINEVAKNDGLIMNLAEILLETRGEQDYNYISQRVRQLARLLLLCKEDLPNITLSDLLVPGKFDFIVKKTRALITDNDKKHATSLGLRIGHSLKKCALIKKSRALKYSQNQEKEEANDFLQVFETEWSERISTVCLKNLYDAKLDKEDILPLTSDIIKLTKYLDQEISLMLKEKDYNEVQWRKLAKLCLCKIIVFNKRRSGEASRMTLENYIKKPTWNIEREDDIYNSLSPLEKNLVKNFDLIKIKGKRGRHVPVITPPDISQALRILYENREHGQISETKNYFFANKGDCYLRGWDVLKECCLEAQIENIKALTSTNVRKYVATTTQILNLKENELDVIARHLGHDINVHRKFYRLQDSTLELSKVTKLLLAMDGGNAHNYAGKSLDDIGEQNKTNICDESFEIDTPDEINDQITMNNNEEKEMNKIETESRKRKSTSNIDISYKVGNKSKNENYIPPKKTQKTKWDPKLKEQILKDFHINIKLKKSPGKLECENYIKEHK